LYVEHFGRCPESGKKKSSKRFDTKYPQNTSDVYCNIRGLEL